MQRRVASRPCADPVRDRPGPRASGSSLPGTGEARPAQAHLQNEGGPAGARGSRLARQATPTALRSLEAGHRSHTSASPNGPHRWLTYLKPDPAPSSQTFMKSRSLAPGQRPGLSPSEGWAALPARSGWWDLPSSPRVPCQPGSPLTKPLCPFTQLRRPPLPLYPGPPRHPRDCSAGLWVSSPMLEKRDRVGC